MKRGRKILWLIPVLALAALAVWGWLRSREQMHEGRPASAWFKDLGDRRKAVAESAMRATRAMGTNALPSIVRLVACTDSGLSNRLAEWANRKGGTNFHLATAAEKRAWALAASRVVGAKPWDATDARAKRWPCLPELVNLLMEEELCEDVLECMNELGISPAQADEVVPGLIRVLKSPRRTPGIGQLGASLVLGQMGEKADAAIPAVIEWARANPDDRASAVWTLGEIHGQPQLVVPILAECLRGTNRYVATAAIGALRKYNARAQDAMPALIEWMKANPLEKFVALEMIGRIHGRPDLALPVLAECLRGTYALTRASALVALAEYGADARPVIPEVKELLSSRDEIHWSAMKMWDGARIVSAESGLKVREGRVTLGEVAQAALRVMEKRGGEAASSQSAMTTVPSDDPKTPTAP